MSIAAITIALLTVAAPVDSSDGAKTDHLAAMLDALGERCWAVAADGTAARRDQLHHLTGDIEIECLVEPDTASRPFTV
ncbi:MAG: hypothetical protein AAF205_10645 [Pseudomonadota bacterium]